MELLSRVLAFHKIMNVAPSPSRSFLKCHNIQEHHQNCFVFRTRVNFTLGVVLCDMFDAVSGGTAEISISCLVCETVLQQPQRSAQPVL